jgi:hypothetical protein
MRLKRTYPSQSAPVSAQIRADSVPASVSSRLSSKVALDITRGYAKDFAQC